MTRSAGGGGGPRAAMLVEAVSNRKKTIAAGESTATCSPTSGLDEAGVAGGTSGESQSHEMHSHLLCSPLNGLGSSGANPCVRFAQLHDLLVPGESQQQECFPLPPWQHDLISEVLGLACRDALGAAGPPVAGSWGVAQLQARIGLAVAPTENATTRRSKRKGRTRTKIDMLE
jgi:hypothetical protein